MDPVLAHPLNSGMLKLVSAPTIAHEAIAGRTVFKLEAGFIAVGGYAGVIFNAYA